MEGLVGEAGRFLWAGQHELAAEAGLLHVGGLCAACRGYVAHLLYKHLFT